MRKRILRRMLWLGRGTAMMALAVVPGDLRRKEEATKMITSTENGATIGRVMALGFLLAALLAACLLVAAAPAHSATMAVDRNDDPDPTAADACTAAPDDCSLRGAIVASNAAAGPDDITVPAGTYTLTRAGDFEDASSTGDLDITAELTITGAGARATSVDGGGRSTTGSSITRPALPRP